MKNGFHHCWYIINTVSWYLLFFQVLFLWNFSRLWKYIIRNSRYSSTRIPPGQHPDSAGKSCLSNLRTPSVNTPRGPQALLPWRSYTGDHPRDRKAQGGPPTTSWPGDVLTPPGPGKSLPPYLPINLRKDTHSFGQLASSLSARRWGMG